MWKRLISCLLSLVLSTYPFGPSFMEYLAGGEEASFDTIQNEIVYLLGTGSCVVDEIGSGTDNKGNAYHFDFVDDAAHLALAVGGRTYTVTKAEQAENGAFSTYWFGQPAENGQEGPVYPFVLHYYKDGMTAGSRMWRAMPGMPGIFRRQRS